MTLQQAARDALSALDGCNLSGIIHSWSRMLTEVLWPEARRLGLGTDWVNRHPLNVLLADKVTQLSGGLATPLYSWALGEAHRLADGLEPSRQPDDHEQADERGDAGSCYGEGE